MTVLPGEAAATVDGPPPADPLVLAAAWLPVDGSAPGPTMTLSTIGLDGYPSARTVLLSRFDGRRLHFHTDTRSRKAAELAAVPRASVTIVWPEAARQLVVTGDVAPVTDREARLAYAARTRYLQVLAWVNDADLAGATAVLRRERWTAFGEERGDGPLEPPTTWGGYALTPLRLLFWQGATDGPSNRLAYERAADGGWRREAWPG
ncbi:pyridoxal 5'-phosphate synthase [Curtobacterium sp. MCPF17_046]|uniref:pyridoxine/pyridoxamine 5'-phosphate oxidase n=1 Tax=Curtobacterium sp. MCPF17_046 TaxID=2175663 RepID=UPI000D8B8033|nr:pyridoxamine 5'-phosphate oxidase family protein [Curtobacterium sp. MCPF17_046]PYY38806.1 pyridoxine 5'-phosphate oxidase [Curtobacterium sp. MCPF17_046]